MNNPDFTTVAAEIAREAGNLLEHYYDQRVAVEYKGEFDLVTAADRASEKLVVAQLRSRFPSHSIVAEEGGGIEQNSGYVWYVDPLDGTTNFAHSFPTFAVSMGLAHNNELVAGVVYDPMRKECFTAERGSGAYLNNRRLHVSKTARFQEGLYATGFASANRRHDVNVHFFHRMSLMTHGVRRPGSAALDLCYVAAGRLEGFWEFGLKSWDVAAGLLLVSEAGGKWGDMRGGPYEVGGPHLAATNGLVHEDLLKVFGDIADGRIETPLPPVKL
jgi:myo-inositol-1(or 4)-monophosphatase